jgi:hypothetical protein
VNPINLTLYDKTLARQGWLNDPDKVTVNPKHLAVGTCSVTVPLEHPKLGMLNARGSRIVIDYQGQTLMSGKRVSWSADSSSGQMTVKFQDDIRILWALLGWPVPGNPITDQGIKQDTRSGPAETVLKHYLSANAARLGLPITIAPDQRRGSNIKAAIRMTPLVDTLLPMLQTASIGLTVKQQSGTLLVDVYETKTYPFVLTEESGIVQAWSGSGQEATTTRVVIGGQGVGTSREFRVVADTATEAATGDVIEAFVDGADLDYPALDADVLAKGQDALAEAAASTGLSLTLSETDNFRISPGELWLGDTVTIRPRFGGSFTEVLSDAVLNWDRDNGFAVTPTIGDRTDDKTKVVATLLGKLARTVRKITTSN